MPKRDIRMRAGIDSAKNMIDFTIEDVRRVCNALLPAALSELASYQHSVRLF